VSGFSTERVKWLTGSKSKAVIEDSDEEADEAEETKDDKEASPTLSQAPFNEAEARQMDVDVDEDEDE